MPHASFKILPGVDTTKTPTLNEAAISSGQLIRFMPDRTLGGVVQKIGGWTKYIGATIGSIARALWAWEDTNANSYLAVGADGIAPITVTGASGDGTTVTLTYAGPLVFPVGNGITVSGISPSGYNGQWTVTASTSTSVSFASAYSTAYVSGGFISGGGNSLNVSTGGSLRDITPQQTVYNVTPNFTTTAGSNKIVVTLAGKAIGQFDSMFLETPVSIGGLILFGQYQCYDQVPASINEFVIYAYNAAGVAANATSSVANAGTVPQFTTINGSVNVTVTLTNHGYFVGDTFTVLISTSVGGITLYGNYLVTNILTANTFTIAAQNVATSVATVSENGGNAYYVIYNGVGPATAGTGYGVGPYGAGGYGEGEGTSAASTGTPITTTDWTLDNWGETLIACPNNGTIYQWSPTSGARVAAAIGASPPVNRGAFVAMPQRQIVSWGSTYTGIQDPLLIRWCDVENYNDWTPSLINQAGSYRIPKGSRVVQCIQGPQQGLVWTDLGLWAMQYVGPPYVYSFNELGTGCGLIGKKAAGSVNNAIYWMGQSQFFTMSGSGPQPIQCPVWDVVFQDLDTDNLDRIIFAANSRFGEVSWYFPVTGGNGENTQYIKYNFILQQWDYGSLGRSAWINESVLGPPIGAGLLTSDPSSYILQHETSYDAVNANGDPIPMNSYFQTGYFTMSEADIKMFVDQIWPDMKWGYYGSSNQGANVLLTFYVTDYPNTPPTAYGPFTLTQATTFITPRFRGRLVSIRLESNDINSWWRLGNIRYRLQQDGKF